MLDKGLAAASAAPLILSILAEGESLGPDIAARLRDVSGGKIDWAGKRLSTFLLRLVRQGLASSRWEWRRRKWYSITAAGREALARQREQWLVVQAAMAQLWGPSKPGKKAGPASGRQAAERGQGRAGGSPPGRSGKPPT
jgi:DNA-binding PadR family transcriptional regulator